MKKQNNQTQNINSLMNSKFFSQEEIDKAEKLSESFTETTTIALGKLANDWSTPALIRANAAYYDKVIDEHRDEIIDAAISLYKKRFPDDERQPVRDHCYMDEYHGIVLCDTEYKLGAYFVGASNDESSVVTLEFDFEELIDG